MLNDGLRAAIEPRKHSKTFSGCWTCRTRRVKCDEVRPACVQCRSKGLDCQGYGVRLRWMPPEQAYSAPVLDAHPLANPRRPQRSLVALDPPRHVLQEL
ncbi:hypothetical protein Micbo1qcDRAFT_170004, partial [Microdochium bolleyi]